MAEVTDAVLARTAQGLWNAWTKGDLLQRLPTAPRPADLGDAYAVQFAMDRFAGPRVGWKLAATGAGGRVALGVEQPLAGPLYERFRVENGGPVVGLLRERYQQESIALEPGDMLVLFTDGISESMNARDEEWGEERMIEFAKKCHGLPAFQAMTRIMAAAEAFAAGASQHDDMTLVVLRILD